ncbi:unnamed protein product [Knipowitschia caucasica]|uniref:Interleukin-1 beta n=1 Tax=Knipowitschia caucasica TaxID=637954 RepID=A0AAV2LU65_KNICA
MEDFPVDGGVLLNHQLTNGKHQYEVKNVMKIQRPDGEKNFLRRGDKLMLVNDTDIQDVSPEKLAHVLSQGSPMLTVHKTIRKKQPEVADDEDVMVPVSKEKRVLSFGLEMRRESDSAQGTLLLTGGDEEGTCKEQEREADFLVVTMKKTTISVVKGRSCDPKVPCHECRDAQCHYNDVVVVAESSTITLVSRGSGSLKCLKGNEVEVEHSSHMYLRALCDQSRAYVSHKPERMTIYYYRSVNLDPRGLPVVLNFTNSNCFLMSCADGDRVLLKVQFCEKKNLKKISNSDQHLLSFVFYMKSEPTGKTTFESAKHCGWFIQVSGSDCEVLLQTEEPREEKMFHILIQTQCGCD